MTATFKEAGWEILAGDHANPGLSDLIISRDGASYAVELKIASEGRTDRMVPLLSQAILEAGHAAGKQHRPMAIVVAPVVPPSVASRLLSFSAQVSPESAVGVFDHTGMRRFHGENLEALDRDGPRVIRSAPAQPSADLFSDLNQWLLKVLLANELPPEYLFAPRLEYRGASDLSRAAQVSMMSASRFIKKLRADGYLDESGQKLILVRRHDLFMKWRNATERGVKESGVRFLVRSNPRREIERLLSKHRGCLGLFAAADAFGVGLVRGIPPHVYLFQSAGMQAPRNLIRPRDAEAPDIMIREPAAPESLKRGCVVRDGIPVSDIIQTFLDVSVHPSRGKEQADLIEKRILASVLHGDSA